VQKELSTALPFEFRAGTKPGRYSPALAFGTGDPPLSEGLLVGAACIRRMTLCGRPAFRWQNTGYIPWLCT